MSLIIKPLFADLPKKEGVAKHKDVYVQCTIGDNIKKCNFSKTQQNPKWNETIIIKAKSPQMRIKVWGTNSNGSNEIIGQTTLDISYYLSNPSQTQTQTIDLSLGGEPRGRLQLQLQYQ